MAGQGTVISIHIAPTGAAPMKSVTNAKAVAGRGLEGDRYYSKLGTYSNQAGSGRDVTLIEIEAIDGLKRDYEVQLDAGQSRRNIVTRGVALNHLVEQEFSIGDVVLARNTVMRTLRPHGEVNCQRGYAWVSSPGWFEGGDHQRRLHSRRRHHSVPSTDSSLTKHCPTCP